VARTCGQLISQPAWIRYTSWYLLLSFCCTFVVLLSYGRILMLHPSSSSPDMIRPQYELRQQARSITSVNCDSGCRWIVAGCSVRDVGTLCSLASDVSDLQQLQTWQIHSGISQLCCDASGQIAATIHDGGDHQGAMRVWRLTSDAATSIVCEGAADTAQQCVSWGRAAHASLLSCTHEAMHSWSVHPDRVVVRCLPFECPHVLLVFCEVRRDCVLPSACIFVAGCCTCTWLLHFLHNCRARGAEANADPNGLALKKS
jgi:hypothetical protein